MSRQKKESILIVEMAFGSASGGRIENVCTRENLFSSDAPTHESAACNSSAIGTYGGMSMAANYSLMWCTSCYCVPLNNVLDNLIACPFKCTTAKSTINVSPPLDVY